MAFVFDGYCYCFIAIQTDKPVDDGAGFVKPPIKRLGLTYGCQKFCQLAASLFH